MTSEPSIPNNIPKRKKPASQADDLEDLLESIIKSAEVVDTLHPHK
jgi:hypothetical protein